MKKKNILIFASVYIPGVKGGGPIRSIKNIIDHLGDMYNFYVITSDRDIGDCESYKDIDKNSWQTIGQAKVFYISPEWYSIKNIKKLISSIDWDYMYLNSFFGYEFSIIPLIIAKRNKKISQKILLAPRGELDKGALNIKRNKKAIYIRLSKLLKLYNDVIWHATCEAEKKYIESIFGKKSHVHIASNLPTKLENINYIDNKTQKVENQLKVVFLSRISRKKNLKFAIETMRNLEGNVSFDIYGPIEDKHYWKECKSLINELPSNIKVEYKGVISNEKVKNTLEKYDLFYLPTHGENFGHVIMEAFLSSCPVLISDLTPWNNLETYKVGWDVPLRDKSVYTSILQRLINCGEDIYKDLAKCAYAYGIKKATNYDDIINHSRLFEI